MPQTTSLRSSTTITFFTTTIRLYKGTKAEPIRRKDPDAQAELDQQYREEQCRKSSAVLTWTSTRSKRC